MNNDAGGRQPSSGSRCRFLTRNDRAALSVAFCNYLSLGQFELARAVYLRLHKEAPATAAKITDTVAALGPPASWLNSISVPSSAHLSWMVAALAAQAKKTGEETDEGLPSWKQSQLEFDILLTEGLLDGAAVEAPHTLTHEVVTDLRKRLFKTLRMSANADGQGSAVFRECTEKTADRLPPLQLLPTPDFLPPVESVLPEARVELGHDPMDQLHAPNLRVHDQLEKMMLSQPLVGRALWSMLVRNLCLEAESAPGSEGGVAPPSEAFHEDGFRGRLKAVGVRLVKKCFDDGRYEHGMWFLQALHPTRANTSSKDDDWYERAVDSLFADIIQRLGNDATPNGAPARVPSSSHAVSADDSSQKRVEESPPKSSDEPSKSSKPPSPPPDPRYLHAALLSQESTALLTRYCLQEDRHVLAQLEQSTLPPPFVAYHNEKKRSLQRRKVTSQHKTSSTSNGDATDQHVFWGHFFTLMWVSREHCLEFVLRRGLEFVHARDFKNAAKLLAPFPPLRPLLLILSVDHPSVADIEAKQKLVTALWKGARNERLRGITIDDGNTSVTETRSDRGDAAAATAVGQRKGSDSERNIEKWCDQIEFVVDLTWWYTEKYLRIPVGRRVGDTVTSVWRAEGGSTMAGAKTSDGAQKSETMARRDRIANAVLVAFERVSMLRVMRECLPALDDTVSSLSQLINQSQRDSGRENASASATAGMLAPTGLLPAAREGQDQQQGRGTAGEQEQEQEGTTELLRFLVQRPRGAETVDVEHRDDLVVLRGYYVLKQVMAWFDMTAQLRAREEEESRLELALLRQNRRKHSRRAKSGASARTKNRKKRDKRRRPKTRIIKTSSVRIRAGVGVDDFDSSVDDEVEDDFDEEEEGGEVSDSELAGIGAEEADVSKVEGRISYAVDSSDARSAPDHEKDGGDAHGTDQIAPLGRLDEDAAPGPPGSKTSGKKFDGSTAKEIRKILKTHIRSTMGTVEKHIMDIVSLPSRVTILENMFRLLFVKRSDLKKKDDKRNGLGSNVADGMVNAGSEREDEPSRDSFSNMRESYVTGNDTLISASETESAGLANVLAVASSLSANESSTNDVPVSGRRHVYIADADLVSAVLTLLRVCLVKTVEKKAPKSATHRPRDVVAFVRANGLLGHVYEGIERLRVVRASRAHFRHRSPSQFMSRMLSHPESLLNVCLKRRDYRLAKRIIHIFELPSPRYTEVAVAEKLDQVSIVLSQAKVADRRGDSGNAGGGAGVSMDISADVSGAAKTALGPKSNPNGDNVVETSFIQDLTRLRQMTHGERAGNIAKRPTTATTTSLRTSAGGDVEALDPHLHTFYMTVDLAVSVAPTAVHSQRLLSEAQVVLDKWLHLDQTKELPSGESTLSGTGHSNHQSFEKGLHDYFSNLVIRRYGKLIDNERNQMNEGQSSEELPPLWTLLKQVENMPMEPTILESHLSNMRSRDHVLDSLKSVFDSSSTTHGGDKDDEVSIDDVMNSFIRQFAKEGIGGVRRTGSVEEGPKVDEVMKRNRGYKDDDKVGIGASSHVDAKEEGKYLLRFLRYIMTISNSLRSAAAAAANPEQKTYDVTSILSRSPRTILADLIFRLGGLKEAEQLSKLMRLDLAKVILRSSGDGGGRMGHADDGAGADGTAAALDQAKDSTGLGMPDVGGVARLRSRNTSEGASGHQLDMNVISYLAALERSRPPLRGLCQSPTSTSSYSPLLAPLAAILRRTSPRLDGRFLAYSLKHSKPYPFLHRWACQRAQAWANLIEVFLDGGTSPGREHLNKLFSLHFSEKDFAKYAKIVVDENALGAADSYASNKAEETGSAAEKNHSGVVKQCLSWLEQEGLDAERQFYSEAIKELRSQGFLKAALSLADAVLPPGSRVERTEQILKQLVRSSSEARDHNSSSASTAIHKYIRRMKDHQAAARFTLQYLREFVETSTAIELLYMCISQLRRIGSTGIFTSDKFDSNTQPPQGHAGNGRVAAAEDEADEAGGHDDDDDEYNPEGSNIVAEAQMLYRRVVEEHSNLLTYRSIMSIPEMSTSFSHRWQDLDEMCFTMPDMVVDRLLVLNQHDLATRVVEMHRNRRASADLDRPVAGPTTKFEDDVSSWKVKADARIQQSYVLYLLVTMKDAEHAFAILEQVVSRHKALEIANNVLGLVEDLNTKLLLAQFIIKSASSRSIDASGREDLSFVDGIYVVELSLKLLIKIPVMLQRENRHLIGRPQLIVENLLLSKNIEVVRSLLREFPRELRNDALVIKAAEKAIDIQNHYRKRFETAQRLAGDEPTLRRENAFPSTTFSGLTGDVSADQTLRSEHRYAEAPSVSLCCEFLDLIADHDPRKAGAVCLDICDKVSLALSQENIREEEERGVSQSSKVHTERSRRLCVGVGARLRPRMVLSMLKHFLHYAKHKFDIVAEQTTSSLPTADHQDSSKKREDDGAFERECEAISFGCDRVGIGCAGWSRQCDQFISCLPLLRTLHALGSLTDTGVPSSSSAPGTDVKNDRGSLNRDGTNDSDSRANTLSYRAVLRRVSLTRLASAPYTRSIRSLLISPGVDRMHLALDVCRACRIEVEPVFAAWGLSLLRVGKLADAREKFSGCLKMLIEKERSVSRERKPEGALNPVRGESSKFNFEEHYLRRVKIVDKIIQILETSISRPKDLRTLQKQRVDFAFQILDGKTFGRQETEQGAHAESNTGSGVFGSASVSTSVSAPAISPLNIDLVDSTSPRAASKDLFQECLHYLKEYGTPQQVLKFYARHGLLKDAVLTLFQHNLPAPLFASVLIDRAVSTGQMRELLRVMQEIDRGRNGDARPYLEAACYWLHDRRFYKWLHRLQSSPSMSDHCGAAMTCESLFVEAVDFDMRIGHLEQAREHYAMAARESVDMRVARVSLRDVYQSGAVVLARGEDSASVIDEPAGERSPSSTSSAEAASKTIPLSQSFSSEQLELRMRQIRVQLMLMQLTPSDRHPNLILLNIGMPEVVESIVETAGDEGSGSLGGADASQRRWHDEALVLRKRRRSIAGQAMLCGHTSLGEEISRAFGFPASYLNCLASAMYDMARSPGWSLSKSIAKLDISSGARSGGKSRTSSDDGGGSGKNATHFDPEAHYSQALSRLQDMCSATEWNIVAGQVIANVKCERRWWSEQCVGPRQHELPSRLLHMFGVALGNHAWHVTRLLAFTGQVLKGVDFAKAQSPDDVAKELLLFLLSEAQVTEEGYCKEAMRGLGC